MEFYVKKIIRCSTAFFIALASHITVADQLDELIDAGAQRLGENQQAQATVGRIHEQTDALVTEYQEQLKALDGLKVYNQLLALQITGQEEERATLSASIANATVIERQIVPLLLRMVDSLETFIGLDVPFLFDERLQRTHALRRLLQRPDLSVAEKCRRVFEAYQIENEYGRTLESYKGKLNLADRTYDVDYLRIGRIALLYRSVGNDEFGYWDQQQRDWVPVTASHYRRNIDKGLKMARQEMAPDLLTIPITPVESVVQ
ncbi:DUF3450 domain-containing protein [Exilibacterium tricleocarpae]|nr:DUF3450 domain-containing protein [Exilibacterium tricleocarpae]